MESKYKIILYWSQEDESFIAEVPELVDCMADGETYNEALENIQVVINEWLETRIEKGFIQKIRRIRDEINSEIINMNSDQIRDYYKKIMEELKEKKTATKPGI